MTIRINVASLLIVLCGMVIAANAEATVTAFFSSGANCNGPPASKFRVGGPEFKVSLCMTTTEEHVCGHSLQLEAAMPADSGHFAVVRHAMGANYADPTLEKYQAQIPITLPPSPHDFGGTRDNPAPPAAKQLLVTFTLRARAGAKKPGYELKLGKNSLVSVGKDGSCLQNTEIPITAILKLNRG